MSAVSNGLAIRARFIFVAALLALLLSARAASACEERGCFGGVQGWGGLFRDNRDMGSFPTYLAVSGWDRGNVWVIERPPPLVYAPVAARPQARVVRVKTRRRRHRARFSASPWCAAQRPCVCCH